MKIPKEIQSEIDHLKKTGTPRCYKCHKEYVNAVDSITGKVSKYLWKPACECIKKPVRLLSMG
jgi:hypothetical protein